MLKPYEQAVLDRLDAVSNPLGWKPYKRNERGEAVMRAEFPLGVGVTRECFFTITDQGIVNHPPQVVYAD